MFCHKCGTELPEGSLFCPSCGARVPEPAKPVATETPAESAKVKPAKLKMPPGHVGRSLAIVIAILALVAAVFIVRSNIEPSPPPVPTPPPVPIPQPAPIPQPEPTPQPEWREVTAAENAALWNAANTALAQFIAEDIRSAPTDSSEPPPQANIELLSGLLNDFMQAKSQLEEVVPPDEHKPMHQTLLPIYSDMSLCMENIIKALNAGDQLAADAEWSNLALLIDEAASVTEMLSLTSDEYTSITSKNLEVVKWKPTTIPIPAGTPPKPDSLLASDAEYYALYMVYESLGWDFNTSYSKYTEEALAKKWTSFWIGSQDDENLRLYFDRAGDQWKPTTIPIPAGTPPKPDSLLASDAEYYALYMVYESWGWDFNTSYSKYTEEASAKKWTSFWIGSQDDENSRLHFDRVTGE